MKQPIERPEDPDLINATPALIRAAQRARELAEKTGTELVFVRNGQLVREIPKSTRPRPTRKPRGQ